LGAPLYQFSSHLMPLAGPASLAGDSLFLPFQFVAEILPYYLGDQYRWDGRRARLEELRGRTTTLAGRAAGTGPLLREELKRRGIGVRMTRTTDTLIALSDRGGYCTEACDLFVSLHINSLKRRPGYT